MPLPRRLIALPYRSRPAHLQLRAVQGENRVGLLEGRAIRQAQAERLEQAQLQRQPVQFALRYVDAAVALEAADVRAVAAEVDAGRRQAGHLGVGAEVVAPGELGQVDPYRLERHVVARAGRELDAALAADRAAVEIALEVAEAQHVRRRRVHLDAGVQVLQRLAEHLRLRHQHVADQRLQPPAVV